MNIESYNGKPVISGKAPIWRHHIFPWGWYELRKLPFNEGDILSSDGYFSPGDGGENTYEIVKNNGQAIDGVTFIDSFNDTTLKSTYVDRDKE